MSFLSVQPCEPVDEGPLFCVPLTQHSQSLLERVCLFGPQTQIVQIRDQMCRLVVLFLLLCLDKLLNPSPELFFSSGEPAQVDSTQLSFLLVAARPLLALGLRLFMLSVFR